MIPTNEIIHGDALHTLRLLPDDCVNMCLTSPPYFGLRDYNVSSQLGHEPTVEQYVQNLVLVFREIKRLLHATGTLWLNLGDSYAGSGKNPDDERGAKPKDLLGIPWLVALALRADGWYLRQDVIWHKPNAMPEPVKDRCTKAHEHIFMLSKQPRYTFNWQENREPCSPSSLADFKRRKKMENKDRDGQGYSRVRPDLCRSRASYYSTDDMRNRRDVWNINTKPYTGAHFATFPPELALRCISLGSNKGDLILDPFMGAGTTALAALKLQRAYLGIELNADYIDIANNRIKKERYL